MNPADPSEPARAPGPAPRVMAPLERVEAGRPLVSVVVPAYNEAAHLVSNLGAVCDYLATLEDAYRWELIVVNDGSSDATGRLAEEFARGRPDVTVLHHVTNLGLGQALRFGFSRCAGDYVVTLDTDLSYSPEHIGALLERMRRTGAKVVVASPYMKGGRISNVPWLRRVLSTGANRFLSAASDHSVSTVTGLVRAYDGPFLRSLSLRARSMEINPEVIYKALLLNERVDEVPGHLNWELQRTPGTARRSSMRVKRQTFQVLLAGFLFRPVMFFIFPGLVLIGFAAYTNIWMFIHFFEQYRVIPASLGFEDRATAAVGAAFREYPYTFIIGLLSLILAIQLLSLGIVALQNREYFKELFTLGTRLQGVARGSREENEG
jgi:glycosyltransferase involved in cell wall biosynthesis